MGFTISPDFGYFDDTVEIERTLSDMEFGLSPGAIFYDNKTVSATIKSSTVISVEVPVGASTGMLQVSLMFPCMKRVVSGLPVVRLSFIGISGDEPKLYNMLYLTVSGLPTVSVSTSVE